MTNDKPNLLVGRLRTPQGDKPRFTKPMTADELFAGLYNSQLVDKIYHIDTVETELGYQQVLIEAGSVIITFLPIGEDAESQAVGKPKPTEPHVAAKTGPRVDATSEPRPVATPSRDNRNLTPKRSSNEEYQFGDDSLPPFPKPKSQGELLAERGLEQPKPKTALKRQKGPKFKRKASKATTPEDELSDAEFDAKYPAIRSKGGRAEITAVIEGSQADRIAASKNLNLDAMKH